MSWLRDKAQRWKSSRIQRACEKHPLPERILLPSGPSRTVQGSFPAFQTITTALKTGLAKMFIISGSHNTVFTLSLLKSPSPRPPLPLSESLFHSPPKVQRTGPLSTLPVHLRKHLCSFSTAALWPLVLSFGRQSYFVMRPILNSLLTR